MLRRGEAEVLRQDRLRDFNVSSDGSVVMAVASGSQSYTVQLDVGKQPPTCNCNCPSGRGHPDRVCKHSLGLVLWRSEQLSLGTDVSDQGTQGRITSVSLVWAINQMLSWSSALVQTRRTPRRHWCTVMRRISNRDRSRHVRRGGGCLPSSRKQHPRAHGVVVCFEHVEHHL